ncbi:hypothetical protein HNP33_002711 [Comamonas odontotermitis]|uniref:Uncharacterized protein n=1 Tax=Comamonas odontotermitis TaxID=379895 RepID=A0ABR6RHN8_9BURK|nr:hypothetical protein [Comamonas odontotermitis]
MHARLSRYTHSPGTYKTRLGTTSHAEAQPRAKQHRQANPTPRKRGLRSHARHPRPARQPPTGASWRAGRRGVGRGHMEGRAMAGHSKPTTRTPPRPPPLKGVGGGGSGRGGVYRIGSYHAGMRTGSSRNPSSDQGPQHRSHRPAIVPKWHGVLPKRCTEKLAATPIVQAPTKLTSVPRRMPKLGSRRPASASQSHIPEKQLQSHARHPRPARQPPTGASWRAGRRGIGRRP